MNAQSIGLIVVALVVVGAIFYLQREVLSLRDQMSRTMMDSARLMTDSQKSIGERLDRAASAVGGVQNSLGVLKEATERVMAVGQNIAQLQDILRAPKMRGVIGELFLGELLSQILPAQHFTLQHAFRSGEIVDAVVRLGRLVPIDSKFPLENFRRIHESGEGPEKNASRRRFVGDVKRHIDAIAAKYLRPDEGTFDFALMYIPAENVYYETILKDEDSDDGGLMSYAFKRRVVPVSPNSLYAYLQTISLGLRGLEMAENARHLLGRIDGIRREFDRFRDDYALLGKHLSFARSKYDESEKRLEKVDEKLRVVGASETLEANDPLKLPAEPKEGDAV